jgi:hypothetical protein
MAQASLVTLRQRVALPVLHFSLLHFVERALYRRGLLPPESIQLLTFVLLQHPAASATMVMHVAGQL